MSYIITEDKYGDKAINTVYNHWNYVELQAIKLNRALKFFINEKPNVRMENAFKTFHAAYGLSPKVGWVGGNVEDVEFRTGGYGGLFEEDNNSGWMILKIKQSEDKSVTFELCNIPGDEICDTIDYEPMETGKYYMTDCPDDEEKDEYVKMCEYICNNTRYNPLLKQEAVELIKTLLPKK
jgi:hypothetical protein